MVISGTIKKATKMDYGRPPKYTRMSSFYLKIILENFRMKGNNKVK